MTQSIFAGPGSETKNWFITPRETDDDVVTFLVCLAIGGLMGCGLLYYFADWIKHMEGSENATFKNWQVVICLTFVLSSLASTIPITILGKQGPITLDETLKPYTMLRPDTWGVDFEQIITWGQTAFVIYQALPIARDCQLLPEAAPWYAASFIFYNLWCYSFCAYAHKSLWVSTVFMIGVPFCLNGAHKALTGNPKVYKPWGTFFFAQIPMAIHLGWTICAALNSFNKLIVRIEYPLHYQVAWGFFGVYFAFQQGNSLMPERRDLILGLTLAFCILSIANGTQMCFEDKAVRGNCLREMFPSRDDTALQAQFITCIFLGASVIINAIQLARDLFGSMVMGG